MLALDFDGTVADTIPKLTELAATVMVKRYSVSIPQARRLYRLTLGAPFNCQLEELFPGHPANGAATDEFATGKRAVTLHADVFPDARELLLTRGDVAVVSSSRADLVRDFMRSHGLDAAAKLLGAVTDGDDSKDAQLRRLGGDVLFVGDAPRDAIYAARAGVSFVAIEHTFSEVVFAGLGLPSVRTLGHLP